MERKDLDEINIFSLKAAIEVKLEPAGSRLTRAAGKYDRFFYCMHEGCEQLFDGKSWPLHAGDVVFIPASVDYVDVVGEDERRGDGCDKTLVAYINTNRSDKKYLSKWSFGEDPDMLRQWTALCDAYAHKKGGWYYACMRRLYDILGILLRKELTQYAGSAGVRRIAPAVTYLEEHYAEPHLSIPPLAAMCGISYSHFRKLFYDVYGTTAKGYLDKLRIDNARRLLSVGDLSLADVAALCGYDDEYYFAAAFKRATGSPPGRYRREAEK